MTRRAAPLALALAQGVGLGWCAWQPAAAADPPPARSAPAPAPAARAAQATQRALDALFAQAAVKPEGTEPTPAPPGLQEDADERTLIAYLARQQRAGADLNAYRFKGTLLLHAIRAGLLDTASWLLAQGADPRLPVQGSNPAIDAPVVAMMTGRWSMLAALQQAPAFASLSAPDRAARLWLHASADQVGELWQRRVPLPRWDSHAALTLQLVVQGMCSGNLGLVQALLNSAAPGPLAAPDAKTVPCIEHLRRPLSTPFTPAQWQALEQRLGWAMWPYALAQTRSVAQQQAVLQSPLRKPWSNERDTRHSVLVALGHPRPAWAVLRSVDVGVLRTVLADDGLLTVWLRRAGEAPLDDLRWALAQPGSARLSAALPLVVNAFGEAASKDPGSRLQRWQALTQLLAAVPSPVPVQALTQHVPHELWSAWHAVGVNGDDVGWARWVMHARPEGLKAAWHSLALTWPDLARRSLDFLFAPVSVGPTRDTAALAISYDGHWVDPVLLEKAQFLQARGVRVATPRQLAAEHAQGPMADALRSQGWALPQAAPTARVERAPLACQARPTPQMRRALALQVPPIQDLQPLAVPGQAVCSWIGRSGDFSGRKFIDDEDFFGGYNRLTPCADGQSTGWLWQEAGQRWTELTVHLNGWQQALPESPLVALRLVGRPGAVQVALEGEQGGCGVRPASVWQPEAVAGGGLLLRPVGPGHEVHDALAALCPFSKLAACLGLEGSQPHAGDRLDLAGAADRWWAADKAAFFTALERLDRPALAAARDAGLFGPWWNEAVARTGSSPDALQDKRRRLAWLLAQRPLVPSLDEATGDGLLEWLPAEDWGPITEAVRCLDPRRLHAWAQHAAERDRGAVAQRLQVALGQRC